MPQVIETTVYSYEELSPEAQEKAREWFLKDWPHYDWSEFTDNEFKADLETLGFEGVQTQFSGFWSQGDGASFDFTGLDLVKLAGASLTTVGHGVETILEEWRGLNTDLLRKALRARGVLSISSTKNGYATHYCHAKTRGAQVEVDSFGSHEPHRINKMADELQVEIEVLARKLANHFYSVLETEYEYLTSAEQVAESIRINDYHFTANGNFFAGA